MTMIIHRIALRGLLLSMALWCFMHIHGAQRDGAAYSVSSCDVVRLVTSSSPDGPEWLAYRHGDWLAFTHALLPSNASGMDEVLQPLIRGGVHNSL